MKTLALVLLLAAPRQDLDQKVAELVARLADDAIDARDQAVRGLSELGPAAIPVLRKAMAKLDAEVRGRVEEAIRAIELRDALSRSLPPLKRITIDHRNRPAREAVEEIARQVGLPVHFEEETGRGAITLALKDVTPIEALDSVCRKDGQLGFRSESADGNFHRGGNTPTRLVFATAPFVDYPAVYVRHYRVSVTELSLTRTNTFQGNQASGSLSLRLQWLPNVRPDSLRNFEVHEAKDEQGRSLLPEKKENEGFGSTRLHHAGVDTSADESIEIKYPEADAKRIAVLKGSCQLDYPKETKLLVFEKPADMIGKSLELHGLKFALEEYKERPEEISIKLAVTGKYNGPKDPAKERSDGEVLDEYLPFSYDEVEAIAAGGERLESNSMSGGGGDGNYAIQLRYPVAKQQSLKEIRIPCVLIHHVDKVEFELKDIAFPK